MTPIVPKTFTKTITDSATGVVLRGTWSGANLVSFSVHLVNKQGLSLSGIIHPPRVRITAAEMDAIIATPRNPGETNAAWLERAAAPWVSSAYGVTPAAPSTTPATPATVHS